MVARLIRPVRHSSRSIVQHWDVNWHAHLPSTGDVYRLVVPGWSQLHDGRTTLGRLLLSGFCSCMLLALLFFGSPFCSVVLGVAIACHGLSVYDCARRSSPDFRDRLFRMLLGCGLLATIVYLPVYSLATSIVNPIIIQADRPPLQAGDVLLVRNFPNDGTLPRVGDVVQYQLPEASVRGQTAAGGAAVFVFRGPRIDRVLAWPGQVIDWNDGQLMVDGQPSSVRPLNPQGAGQRLSFTVPTDFCFILPSTDFVNLQVQVTAENWKQWSLVPVSQIEGRIIWRSWPWTRLGFVR